MCLALGALLVSSANSKTAEARSSLELKTAKVETAPSASNVLVSREPAIVDRVSPAPEPVAKAVEIITPPPADLRLEDPKLRRMRNEEITKNMLEAAARIVHKYHAKPVGTRIEVEVDGKRVVARIERHFHPEGGPVKPWGFHPGVSLFAWR